MSTAPVTQDATSKPFEMTLGDGTVVKGATMEEAFQTLAKMKVDTANALREARQDKERLELEIAKRNEPVHQPAGDGKFSRDKYYQMLNEDPIEAQNYLDRFRFGVPDPVNAFNSMRESVDAIQQQAVAAAFTAQHAEDFPATPDAARVLRERTERLISEGFPYNLRTVNLAYSELVGEGSIKPLEKTPAVDNTPPPSLTGSTGQLSDPDVQRAEQMSDDDLRKLLISKGLLR